MLTLPQFSTIDVVTFTARLEILLATHRQKIARLLQENSDYTWDNLLRPLEEMDDELERFFSPLAHLHAVMDAPDVRDCYQACLPLHAAHSAAIHHDAALYAAINSVDKSSLDVTQCKIIADNIRNFKLSGVALPFDGQKRFEAITTRLSALENKFETNLLDATGNYSYQITDEARLSGLPEHALARARELALERSLDGYTLTLETPCYLAVMTTADDRALRETLYHANITRASETGPDGGRFDNTAVIDEILVLRQEKASMLGFNNYAELSLATKMASSTAEVVSFLSNLADKARCAAVNELQDLRAFAASHYNIDVVEPWDIAYLSEKKMHNDYGFSVESLRPYFPLNKVLSGLFTIVNRLFGITFAVVPGVVDKWHTDVACYQVLDEQKVVRGCLYMDLFARKHKRSGAWMDSLQSRYKHIDGAIQLPIATLTCNFAKVSGEPILSHDEVVTLFHEMGHCLNHVLTTVDYIGASGLHGVEWDAVELPSQFLENWCWVAKALPLLTAHVETGEPLPETSLQQLLAAKNFQSALAMMRQIEFSLFDFCLHRDYKKSDLGVFVKDTIATVRNSTRVVPTASYDRFQNGFAHIFSGGYAAGYYSYKWAEVLSCDAFSRFEEEGVFNAKTGRDFLHCILEVGGGRPAAEFYVNFRRRPATIDALLRHSGMCNLTECHDE